MKIEEAITNANIAANNVDEDLFSTWEKACKVVSAAFLASLRANGFVVVPVEATEKMMRSACEIDCGLEVCDDAGKWAHDTRWHLYAETWRYMLAAAQENDDGR